MGSWAVDESVTFAREMIQSYNDVLERLTARYNADSAKAVGTNFIVQPFGLNADFSSTSLISEDCFHPSKEGQSLLARGLWNNMVQGPLSAKDTDMTQSAQTFCPTADSSLQ
jgi:hypothetical protein